MATKRCIFGVVEVSNAEKFRPIINSECSSVTSPRDNFMKIIILLLCCHEKLEEFGLEHRCCFVGMLFFKCAFINTVVQFVGTSPFSRRYAILCYKVSQMYFIKRQETSDRNSRRNVVVLIYVSMFCLSIF